MIDQHANSTAAEPDLDATVPADAEAALNASLTLEALPGPAWPWLTMPAPPSMLPGAGRPGASSKAAYRQQRRSEWRTWRASLRWRIAAAVAVGALVTGPRLAWSNGAAAAAGVGLALRFRPSAGTRTCWEGARGERRTARLLAPLEHEGSVIFHDLAPPDHGTGTVAGWVAPPQPPNLDHLVIGPTGVFLVDSWRCHSMLRVDPQERLWHRGEPLGAVLQALRRGAREATVALADARAPAVGPRRLPAVAG